MTTSDTRDFPLGDILSVTTPYLLSRNRMQGLCDLVDWMTFAKPTPDQITLPVWNEFRTRSAIARTAPLRQHPHLEGVCPRTELDEADLYAWLIEQERVHGQSLPVARADVEMAAIIEGLSRACQPLLESLGNAMAQMTRAFMPVIESVERLGSAIEEAGDGPR